MHDILIPHCNGQSKEQLKPGNRRGKKKKSEAKQGRIRTTGPCLAPNGERYLTGPVRGQTQGGDPCGDRGGGDRKKAPPQAIEGGGAGKRAGGSHFGGPRSSRNELYS